MSGLTESHPDLVLVVAVDVLYSRDLEAPRLEVSLDVVRVRRSAVALIAAGSRTLAALGAALAAEERVVGVDVPAGRTGKDEIVDVHPFDLALDADEQCADEIGQSLVAEALVSQQQHLDALVRAAGADLGLVPVARAHRRRAQARRGRRRLRRAVVRARAGAAAVYGSLQADLQAKDVQIK